MEGGAAAATTLPRATDMSPAANPLLQIPNFAALGAQMKDPKISANFRNLILKFGFQIQPRRDDHPEPRAGADRAGKQKAASKGKKIKKAPRDPTKPRPPKRAQFKHCVSRGIRHNYVPYIRSISTPDWAEATIDPIHEEKVEGFDRLGAHRELEIYESRILCGMDPLNFHPVLARKAKEEDRGLVLCLYECEKAQRYETERVKEKIPKFWPARPWDTDETRMNDAETAAMEKRLKEEEEKLMADFTARSSPLLTPRRTQTASVKLKKPQRTTLVELHAGNFLTSSDDDTDLDDF